MRGIPISERRRRAAHKPSMSHDADLLRLDQWLQGCISEEDFAILQQRLRESAELRSKLRAMAALDEGLMQLSLTPKAILPKVHVAERNYQAGSDASQHHSRWLPWAIAAAAALIAVIAWFPRASVKQDSSGSYVTAMLVDEAGAAFSPPRLQGDVRFAPGSYELKSGMIHLRFVNGADLVVEGPAQFQIRDAFRTDLAAGRVRAIVPPPAHGFTVVTREVAYEDVGTEFGLSMNAVTGESQMHVFDGQVNLRSGDALGSLLRSLYVGESVGYRDGRMEEVPEMDVSEFPSPENIGYQRWVSQRRERLADPSLIAWFPFERGPNASVLANAVRAFGTTDGRIAGARWATGRWPGKQALWFDRESDFSEIEIPGEYSELSVAVWLKVDRLEHEMNAILNSNGADPGDFHFQMNRLGLPRGGLVGVPRPVQRWVGNPVPTGKWVLVVSVISLPQRRHVIYVNGQPVMDSQVAGSNVSIQPGHCRLGNWLGEGFPGGSTARGLRGLIDELSVWNRALSQSEVVSLTESGRPSMLWSRENPPLKVPMPKP